MLGKDDSVEMSNGVENGGMGEWDAGTQPEDIRAKPGNHGHVSPLQHAVRDSRTRVNAAFRQTREMPRFTRFRLA